MIKMGRRQSSRITSIDLVGTIATVRLELDNWTAGHGTFRIAADDKVKAFVDMYLESTRTQWYSARRIEPELRSFPCFSGIIQTT